MSELFDIILLYTSEVEMEKICTVSFPFFTVTKEGNILLLYSMSSTFLGIVQYLIILFYYFCLHLHLLILQASHYYEMFLILELGKQREQIIFVGLIIFYHQMTISSGFQTSYPLFQSLSVKFSKTLYQLLPQKHPYICCALFLHWENLFFLLTVINMPFASVSHDIDQLLAGFSSAALLCSASGYYRLFYDHPDCFLILSCPKCHGNCKLPEAKTYLHLAPLHSMFKVFYYFSEIPIINVMVITQSNLHKINFTSIVQIQNHHQMLFLDDSVTLFFQNTVLFPTEFLLEISYLKYE